MDRYYAILARSIAALGRDDMDARHSVYVRVRGELDRLIASANPKMPTSEQIAHQSSLEQAIARIEEEYTARDATAVPQHAAAQTSPIKESAPPPATWNAGPRIAAFWKRKPKPKTAKPVVAPQSDMWGDEKAARGGITGFLKSRTGKLIGAALIAVLAVCVGGYLILSGLNTPSVPGSNAIASQLKNRGAATLFLGAAAASVNASRGTAVEATGGILDPGAVRISSRVKETPANAKAKAARISLDRSLRNVIADKTLRVTVVARSADDRPSPKFALAVADGNQNTTGWQEFDLTGEFRPYTIEYAFSQNVSRPVIAIWADVAGANRAVEVNEVSVRLLPN